MAELRIPREDERKQIEQHYECIEKGCIYAEALISVSYRMFQECLIPRVRCSKNNLMLNPDSKICGSFEKND